MILPDFEIARLCEPDSPKPMITPFVGRQVRQVGGQPVISYGLSSYGYDIRIADTFSIYTRPPTGPGVIDPKALNGQLLTEYQGSICTLPPYSYALGHSVERFAVPDNVLVVVLGKSTLARAGLIVNVTPGEPGWEGHWTIELCNSTGLDMLVYANEGIAQCIFLRGTTPPRTLYDSSRKYQGQQGITLPKV